MPVHYSSFGAALRPLGRQCRRGPHVSTPSPSILTTTARVNVANKVSRNFTISRTLQTGRQEPEHHNNHYETLNVHFDATQAEIKKYLFPPFLDLPIAKLHHTCLITYTTNRGPPLSLYPILTCLYTFTLCCANSPSLLPTPLHTLPRYHPSCETTP